MADVSGLPSLAPTVDLGGGPQIEGDSLEAMRKAARTNINLVNKNTIVKKEEKLAFKREVLKRLKNNMGKFDAIDKKYAAQKATEPVIEEEETPEEEDPFADIFGSEAPTDESVQEKMTIAQQFISNLKLYKTEFLKQIRLKREQAAKKQEEKKMEEILAQLNTAVPDEPKVPEKPKKK
jgi:hypothetical protein